MPDEKDNTNLQDNYLAENPNEDSADVNEQEVSGKKKRKPRFSPEDHLPEFRELAKAGKSQEEICDKMKLDNTKFSALFYLLCQTDNVLYKIEAKVPLRKTKVKDNGFMVTSSRLSALGLGDIFTEGKELRFKRDGRSLVIDVVDS